VCNGLDSSRSNKFIATSASEIAHDFRQGAQQRRELPENQLTQKQNRDRQGAVQRQVDFVSGACLIYIRGLSKAFAHIFAGGTNQPKKQRREGESLPLCCFPPTGLEIRA